MATQKNVILVGVGPGVLRQSSHIATGGEGSVYRLGGMAAKIFTDPGKMLQDDMVGKVGALSQIKHPWIVAPQGIVTDSRHTPIGYYMPYVVGQALPRYFTNDFRTQVGFTDSDSSHLAEGMRQIVQVAHDNLAVIVDGNENAWLIHKGVHPEPRIVDVDSWQIRQWKAKVIMPSIMDYHKQSFNKLTDWFSWGVVTFQLYTGIHPFKGTLDGYARNDFISRMKANASVFSPGVRLNQAVRDFSCIPPRLRSWYERTFQTTERTKPPSPFDSAVKASPQTTVLRVVVQGHGGQLVFKRLYQPPANDRVIRVFDCGVALLSSKALVNLNNGYTIGHATTLNCEVVYAEGGWLVVENQGDMMQAWYTEGRQDRTDITLALNGSGLLRFQNRIFVVTSQGLSELVLHLFSKPVVAVSGTWSIMESSTQLFEGLGVQDTLGSKFLLLPHGTNMLSYLKTPELDKLRVVNARGAEGYVVVVGIDSKGAYQKFEYVMAKDYTSYAVSQTEVDSPELILAALPQGQVASVVQDGELLVFVPANGKTSIFTDKSIATNEPLFCSDNKIVLIRAGSVWHVSVR
jgi:hypothetical protein